MTSWLHHSRTTGLVPCPKPDPAAGHSFPGQHSQQTLCEAGRGRWAGSPWERGIGTPHCWPQHPQAAQPAETL